MRKHLKYITEHLGKREVRVLGFESLLFSGVFGAAYQSWMVFGGMLCALCWALSFSRGKNFTMIVLSCLWGIIAASIGHSLGGWLWAIAFGMAMVLLGVSVHTRSLDLSFDRELFVSRALTIQMINHRWRRQGWN